MREFVSVVGWILWWALCLATALGVVRVVWVLLKWVIWRLTRIPVGTRVRVVNSLRNLGWEGVLVRWDGDKAVGNALETRVRYGGCSDWKWKREVPS